MLEDCFGLLSIRVRLLTWLSVPCNAIHHATLGLLSRPQSAGRCYLAPTLSHGLGSERICLAFGKRDGMGKSKVRAEQRRIVRVILLRLLGPGSRKCVRDAIELRCRSYTPRVGLAPGDWRLAGAFCFRAGRCVLHSYLTEPLP